MGVRCERYCLQVYPTRRLCYIKWESRSLSLKYICELAESCKVRWTANIHIKSQYCPFLKHHTLTAFLKVMDDAIFFFTAYDLSDWPGNRESTHGGWEWKGKMAGDPALGRLRKGSIVLWLRPGWYGPPLPLALLWLTGTSLDWSIIRQSQCQGY